MGETKSRSCIAMILDPREVVESDDDVQSLDALTQLSAEENSLISERRWLVAMVREFGGVENVVKAMKNEFDAAPARSPLRTKYFEMLMKWVQHFGAVESASAQATPEDLEAQVVIIMERYFRAAMERCNIDEKLIKRVLKVARELAIGSSD